MDPMDHNALLRFRGLVVESPPDSLCQAQECELPPPPEVEETTSKKKASSKAKSRAKGGKESKEAAQASGEGAPPWRKPSPTASPTLEPQDKANPPWRKSPQGGSTGTEGSPPDMEKLPSPAASDRMPTGDEPDSTAFEMTLGEGEDDAGEATLEALGEGEEWQAKEKTWGKEWKDEWKKDWKGNSDGKWKGQDGWITSTKEEGGPPLPSDLTVAGLPPPPLASLAGGWFDSLGNMIQIPLYPPVAFFQGQGGFSQHELTQDKWGRLWCGNGVLHQVGYSGGPLAQDMPPSHLSFRTTAWKFSVWERVAAPPLPPAPPEQEKGNSKGRRGGKNSGKGKAREEGKGKGKGKADRQEAGPQKPDLPTLGDFLAFPSLGETKKSKKSEKSEKS